MSPHARFPIPTWNYHQHTLLDGDTSNTTTNSLENVNLRLKRFLGQGFISHKTALTKLKSFHTEMICRYTECIVGNRMNNIRRHRIEREKNLLAKLTEYSNLTTDQKIDNLEMFALQFGCYTSDRLSPDLKKNSRGGHPGNIK